jgi:hypothetical protein
MGFRRGIAIVIALVVALGLFLALGYAREKDRDDKPKDCTAPAGRKCIVITQKSATSTFFSSVFNFDPTKGKANEAIYFGEGSEGKFTGQGISQSFPDGKNCVVSDGSNTGTELKLVGHVASTRFEDGSLLFEHGDPGDLTACFDGKTFTFHETGTVKIIGGTGRWAGATGTEAVVQDGGILDVGDGNWAFGFSAGHFDATFTVPATK